ncbi:MAG: aminotransferase class I/II-fold pyridoxal phosphate-dependent enzyme [Actinomycetota bacterium]
MTSSRIDAFTTEQLRGLHGIKWSRDGPDVLPAWVADMDIRPPAPVRAALADLVERSDFGYHRSAFERLPEVFARWQSEHHGWTPDLDGLRVFCDVLHAIDTVLWLHTAPGDGIVLLTPVYPPFLRAVEGADRRLIDVPLDPDGWRLDADRLAAAVDVTTRAVLLCNPHNPTGRVFDRAELAAIVEVAEANDLLLISDEVWADLLHPGATHVPLASLGPEAADRTVTVSSASKAFNLAGLRCALAHIGPPELASTLDRLPAHLTGAVGIPGAVASMVAWEEGEEWLASLRTHLTARRDQLADRLATDLPGVAMTVPEATYLAWLDFRPLGLGPDPHSVLLERGRVALSPGPDFGRHGHGFARLNFATSAEILDEIVDRVVAGAGGEGG